MNRLRGNSSKQGRTTSVPNAPVRRMHGNDIALMNTHNWSGVSELNLEDRVSLCDLKAVFLQGNVAFVGNVHFAEGIWVGIQLTGPSVGRGNTDGTVQGRHYFANVGKKNGRFAPLTVVNKRLEFKTGDPVVNAAQLRRRTEQARMADVNYVECLRQERAIAILKQSEKKQKTKRFSLFEDKEETHITRLKQYRLEELRRSRQEVPDVDLISNKPNNKYSNPDQPLEKYDFEFVNGLEETSQNFCLSDPSLPDNPITFASQAFLNMTGYTLNQILGRNCRFLQGPKTDAYHVHRLRMSIREGSDCSVCLLNYRADGTNFYNHLFITALRDTKGRIKNYIGVQCEVSRQVAEHINDEEKSQFEAKSIGTTNPQSAGSVGSHQSKKIGVSSNGNTMAEESHKTVIMQHETSGGGGEFEFADFSEEKKFYLDDEAGASFGSKSLLTYEDDSSLPSTSKSSQQRALPPDVAQLETAFLRSNMCDNDLSLFVVDPDDPPMRKNSKTMKRKKKSSKKDSTR
jgi:PAS domain S-box-containing protein